MKKSESKFIQITFAPSGVLYALDSDGIVWRWDYTTNKWVRRIMERAK